MDTSIQKKIRFQPSIESHQNEKEDIEENGVEQQEAKTTQKPLPQAQRTTQQSVTTKSSLPKVWNSLSLEFLFLSLHVHLLYFYCLYCFRVLIHPPHVLDLSYNQD